MPPTIWCMNLKDNRDEPRRNRDMELKFRLCRERSMIAIGWAVEDDVNSWEEYILRADIKYQADTAYATARKGLQSMKPGDLVWTQNPVTHEHYLVEITDKTPRIYGSLEEFDICGCRSGTFYLVPDAILTGALSSKNLSARHTIERIRIDGKRNASIEATKFLFDDIKHNGIKNNGG